jgi:hypothetical protein
LLPTEFLFGSGALQCSYISKKFVDTNRASLEQFVFPAQGHVFMADGVTLRTISEEIRMPVSFVADDGTDYSAMLEFSILDMPQQAIIGLPHIILNLLELYVGMLQSAKESLTATLRRFPPSCTRTASVSGKAVHFPPRRESATPSTPYSALLTS